jgi:hypothetical protein
MQHMPLRQFGLTSHASGAIARSIWGMETLLHYERKLQILSSKRKITGTTILKPHWTQKL